VGTKRPMLRPTEGSVAAGDRGDRNPSFDPPLSFGLAKTSSLLKLAAFCRCG